ncbi:MAG: cupin, partial [Rhodomicrobium sp.]
MSGRNASATDPGPENAALRSVSRDEFMPPKTDHGLLPPFWNSFSLAHRRVQEGGWSRQVNVET